MFEIPRFAANDGHTNIVHKPFSNCQIIIIIIFIAKIGIIIQKITMNFWIREKNIFLPKKR